MMETLLVTTGELGQKHLEELEELNGNSKDG
jgi:hypothetical protein